MQAVLKAAQIWKQIHPNAPIRTKEASAITARRMGEQKPDITHEVTNEWLINADFQIPQEAGWLSTFHLYAHLDGTPFTEQDMPKTSRAACLGKIIEFVRNGHHDNTSHTFHPLTHQPEITHLDFGNAVKATNKFIPEPIAITERPNSQLSKVKK
jgi:hypothetical protein